MNDPFDWLGFGTHAYMKFILKIAGLFAILTLISVPNTIMYGNGQ